MGIDPGLAETGIGIVKGRRLQVDSFAYGLITTASQTSLPRRLEHIYGQLGAVLQQERPDLLVLEDVFSLASFPKSGITLGKVIGVIMLAACQSGVEVVEIPVREAKQVLTGNGNARKEQLEKAVRHHLRTSEPLRPFHISDALALALIGLFRNRHGLFGVS